MKTVVYLLYYDTDTGGRECWNTFHTPCEAFSTPDKREDRKKQLQKEDSELEFHEEDLKIH